MGTDSSDSDSSSRGRRRQSNFRLDVKPATRESGDSLRQTNTRRSKQRSKSRSRSRSKPRQYDLRRSRVRSRSPARRRSPQLGRRDRVIHGRGRWGVDEPDDLRSSRHQDKHDRVSSYRRFTDRSPPRGRDRFDNRHLRSEGYSASTAPKPSARRASSPEWKHDRFAEVPDDSSTEFPAQARIRELMMEKMAAKQSAN